jgi:hypothetical protein
MSLFVRAKGGVASSNPEKIRMYRMSFWVNLLSKLFKVATARYCLQVKAKSAHDDDCVERQQISFLQNVVRIGKLGGQNIINE